MQRSLPLAHKIFFAHSAGGLAACNLQLATDSVWPAIATQSSAGTPAAATAGPRLWQGVAPPTPSQALLIASQGLQSNTTSTSTTTLCLAASNQLLQRELSLYVKSLATPPATHHSSGAECSNQPEEQCHGGLLQQFELPLITPGASQPEIDAPAHQQEGALQCSRGTTWQPSTNKRLNKHGLEKRLSTPEGRFTIMNRIKKGRWRLTVDQVVGQRQDGGTRLK